MQKYLNILLAFIVSFFVISANAQTPPEGGWKWDNARITVEKEMAANRLKVEAQKTYPVSTLGPDGKPIVSSRTARSTIRLAPTAANVGKSLVKRIPSIAISTAIYTLAGSAVDWVMSPDNTAVLYTVKVPNPNPSTNSPDEYMPIVSGFPNVYYPSNDDACRAGIIFINDSNYAHVSANGTVCNITYYGYPNKLNLQKRPNPLYDPTFTNEQKSIPIEVVADQVIQDANNNKAPALQVLSDTALDMLEDGLLDDQLDDNSDFPQPDPDAVTQNPPNPENPPKPETQPPKPDGTCPSGYVKNGNLCLKTEKAPTLEFPIFCSWAAIVCEWAGWSRTAHEETKTKIQENTDEQIKTNEKLDDVTDINEEGQKSLRVSLPNFCNWATTVCDFFDWVKEPPDEPPEDGEVDVQEPDPNMHVPILERLYISMPAQCPADPVLEFMGGRIPFPMSVFCQFASMMKPLILLFAYIKGLSIIGNGLA